MKKPKTIPILKFSRFRAPQASSLTVARFSSLWLIPFTIFFLSIGYILGVASGSSGSHRTIIESTLKEEGQFSSFFRSIFLSFDATDPNKPGLPQVVERLNALDGTLKEQDIVLNNSSASNEAISSQCLRMAIETEKFRVQGITPAFNSLSQHTVDTKNTCENTRRACEASALQYQGLIDAINSLEE